MILSRVLNRLFQRPSSGRNAGEGTLNPLSEYFFNNNGRLLNKWHHYFDIYHRHFAQFRGRAPVIVEVGVWYGGSLQMWHDYFGPGTRVVGIDIDPDCRKFEEANTTILIGDQADRNFLEEVRRQVPHVDILLDDGGHRMEQQIATFEELYPHIQPNGIYLCEDVHTSFLAQWGGGYSRQDSFLEYSKRLIDRLYAWYSMDGGRVLPDSFTKSTFGLHFYDSVVVIEKRPVARPVVSETGRSD